MPRMVQRWYWVPLALIAPGVIATGCGDDENEKRARDAENGGATSSGGAGESGSVDPGAAGLGGEAPQPGSGGNAGSDDAHGGAPLGGGGAAPSLGGADQAAAGAAGSSAFVSACSYPNGGACDEISGTLEDSLMFQQECSNNERISLDACPTANVAGACTYPQAGAILRASYYAPIDAEELEAAEQACVDGSGEWVQP